jgi:hypothetical protein
MKQEEEEEEKIFFKEKEIIKKLIKEIEIKENNNIEIQNEITKTVLF